MNSEETYTIKQSIFCEVTLSNYLIKYPNLKMHDFCPKCKDNNKLCLLRHHKNSITYFYAYKDSKRDYMDYIKIPQDF